MFCCQWANRLKRRITVVMSRLARFADDSRARRIGRLTGYHAPRRPAGWLFLFRGRMGIRVKAEDAQVATVTGVFALRGGNRRALIATLERIAAIAPHLSGAELRGLAGQLGRDTAARPG